MDLWITTLNLKIFLTLLVLKRMKWSQIILFLLLFITGYMGLVYYFSFQSLTYINSTTADLNTIQSDKEDNKILRKNVQSTLFRISKFNDKDKCLELQDIQFDRISLGIKLSNCGEIPSQVWTIEETVTFPYRKVGYTRMYKIKPDKYQNDSTNLVKNQFSTRAWNITRIENGQYIIQRPLFENQCISYDKRTDGILIQNCTNNQDSVWSFKEYQYKIKS